MVMLSFVQRRIASGGNITRCITAAGKRNSSILASSSSAAANYIDQNTSCKSTHHVSSICNTINYQHHSSPYSINSNRLFSKYASVDHSAAYSQSMESQHGAQLELAIEEGRGKDDTPFDPFSQFLDEMGDTVDIDDDIEDGVGEKDDDIEEAEYKTVEEFDDEEEEESDDDEVTTDELDEEDEEDEGPMYTNTGALYRPKSEKLALRAGYPAGGKFAVILLSGFQHKVTVDDLLVVNKLKPVSNWSVGSTHTILNDDILLMADQNKTLVGLPSVKGGEVDVMVEEITRDKTLIIFKKRRRKHSRRKNGFRREVTFLRVLDVRMPGEEKGELNRGDGVDLEEEEEQIAA